MYWGAEKYGSVGAERDKNHKKMILDEIEFNRDDVVLDLACGSGFLTFDLAERVPQGQVIGIDLSEDMIEEGKEKLTKTKLNNVEFLVKDVATLPFEENFFDTVTCRFAFHHFPDPEDAIEEIYRILKENGVFILSDIVSPKDKEADDFLNDEANFDPTHVRFYNENELEEMMSEFKEINRKYYEVKFEMSEMKNSRTAGTRGVNSKTARENFQKFKNLYENASSKIKEIFKVKEKEEETYFSWNSIILTLKK